ncbi:MAG: response regulator [Spirochaetota bacterium]
MARILVVDDDKKTVATIALYLRNEGHTVLEAYDGGTAVERFRVEAPDLLILDLMLPGIDGIDIARLVRLDSDVPVIMLTARTFEDDRLAGFAAGADDYISKPFSPRELVARVNAVLRRTGAEHPDDVITIGPLTIDTGAHDVRVDGMHVKLTPTEFRLLEALARRPGRVFTRNEIVDRVFGRAYPGLERSVDTHLSNLRGKLHSRSAPDVIVTVHGVGYKLQIPAKEAGNGPHDDEA